MIASFLILLAVQPLLQAEQTGPLSDMEALELFNQAAGLYQSASELPDNKGAEAVRRYQEAAALYEKILGRGFVHSDVYYNLGNTYFKLNKWGPAILNYRRAQHFMPANADLRENILSAKSRILDKEPDRNPPELLRTLCFWHYDTSNDFLARAVLVVYLALCATAGVNIFARRAFLRSVIGLSSVVLAVLLLSFGIRLYQDKTKRMAVVMVSVAPVRAGYADHEVERFPVHEGAELDVEDDYTDASGQRWLKVSLGKDLRGWIRGEAVEIIQKSPRADRRTVGP